MSFNSSRYFFFFMVVFFVNWTLASRRPQQLWFLLAASYFFYAASSWQFLLLLIGFTIVNFALNLRIEAGVGRARKLWCGLAIAVSLLVLAGFKYLDFFAQSIYSLAQLSGSDLSPPHFGWALPLGVSFYTFSSIAYSVEIYRRKVPAARSLRDYALYLAFFPKVASGPIARPGQLAPQFPEPCEYDHAQVMSGVYLILYGLLKKVVVADLLASMVVNPAYENTGDLSLPMAWLTMWSYTIQIFCDFSGYTDMAIGSARILGFDLPENFNRPYLAANPQEFWRRWHITLSTWLRDYLYISLGGSRHGRARTYLALFLTMLLGGLWHGSAWTFVIWGAYHGVLLMGHRLLNELFPPTVPAGSGSSRIRALAGIFLTFNLIGIGWIFFRAPGLDTALAVISRLFVGQWTLPQVPNSALLVLALGILLHNSLRLRDFLGRAFVQLHPAWQGAIALTLLSVYDLFTSVSQPFIYNRF